MSQLIEAFKSESSRYLREVYLGRFERALARLPEADLWWRPQKDAMTFGNLLLHLEGNVRQWILAGLDGRPNTRDRDGEFAANGDAGEPNGQELLERLRVTVGAACEVIDALPEERMLETVTIQENETTVQDALYHVVEHFGYHTGQAAWIAKARAHVPNP